MKTRECEHCGEEFQGRAVRIASGPWHGCLMCSRQCGREFLRGLAEAAAHVNEEARAERQQMSRGD